MTSPLDAADGMSLGRPQRFPLASITKDIYMRVGQMYDTESQQSRDEQFAKIHELHLYALNVIHKARTMIRYEETRLKQAVRGARLVREGHKRFHHPDWQVYYNSQKQELLENHLTQEHFCLICHDETQGALFCQTCMSLDSDENKEIVTVTDLFETQ